VTGAVDASFEKAHVTLASFPVSLAVQGVPVTAPVALDSVY